MGFTELRAHVGGIIAETGSMDFCEDGWHGEFWPLRLEGANTEEILYPVTSQVLDLERVSEAWFVRVRAGEIVQLPRKAANLSEVAYLPLRMHGAGVMLRGPTTDVDLIMGEVTEPQNIEEQVIVNDSTSDVFLLLVAR